MDHQRIVEQVDAGKPEGVGQGRRLITFLLGDEMYCVDIVKIKEIIRLSLITRVPKTPPYIIGVTNLRGDILSVVDFGQFLGLGMREISDDSRIMVTEWQGDLVGILVDEVRDTIDLCGSRIQPPLLTWAGKGVECVEGEIERDGTIFILIELEKVLGSSELEKLSGRALSF